MPKYDSIDTIKAKVFFKVLETKNYQLLKPKNREKGLEAVFMRIYDEFFTASDNMEAKQYLELTGEIASLEYKLTNLKRALSFYYYNKTTKQMRLDFIAALKEGYDIDIDPEADFTSEVLRVLNTDCAFIENELTMLLAQYKEMTQKSQSKANSYERSIVGIENVLKRSVNDDITLAKYVELERAAKQIVTEHQKQQMNKKAA